MLPVTGEDRKRLLYNIPVPLEAVEFHTIEPATFEADYSPLEPYIEKREALQSEISELETKQAENLKERESLRVTIADLKQSPILHEIDDISDEEFVARTLELDTAKKQLASLPDYSDELDLKRKTLTALNAKIAKIRIDINEAMFRSFTPIVNTEIDKIHESFHVLQNQLNDSIKQFKGMRNFCHDNIHPTREINRQGIGDIDLNKTALDVDKFLNHILQVLHK